MKKDFDGKMTFVDSPFQPHAKNEYLKEHLCNSNSSKRMCFIVTEKRSNSWATDLYACERKPNRFTVFH